MESFLDFLGTDNFLIIILGGMIILLILYIANVSKLSKIRREYKDFMEKLGKGKNIDEMLKKYIKEVENVSKQNKEIIDYCEELNKDISRCTQKIGMVRYNAFKDTGSDLSFALALLDQNNDGVVLNGIYARDMSNIYAKPIKEGKSSYVLSEEEKEAIQKAINNEE